MGTTCLEDEINYQGTCLPAPLLEDDNTTSIIVGANSRAFFLVEISDAAITNALKVMLFRI